MAPRRNRIDGSGVSACCALLLALAGCGGSIEADPEDDGEGVSGTEPVAEPVVPDRDVYPDESAGAGTLDDGIAALNAYRARAGLGAVVADATWSSACLGHLRYLDHLSVSGHGGACVLLHDEPDEANPHHAPLHENAAAGALLACDRNGLGLGRAVDRWVNSLYHRLPLLDPGLVRVGAATYAGFACLHYASGTVALDTPRQVVWPPDGTLGVPRGFVGREQPCPTTPLDPQGTPATSCPASGFILTSTWYGPEGPHTTGWTNEAPVLLREDGQIAPLLAWYADGVPGHDPVEGLIPRTVAWVPASSLAQTTGYRARMAGTSWSFRTGSRFE